MSLIDESRQACFTAFHLWLSSPCSLETPPSLFNFSKVKVNHRREHVDEEEDVDSGRARRCLGPTETRGGSA